MHGSRLVTPTGGGNHVPYFFRVSRLLLVHLLLRLFVFWYNNGMKEWCARKLGSAIVIMSDRRILGAAGGGEEIDMHCASGVVGVSMSCSGAARACTVLGLGPVVLLALTHGQVWNLQIFFWRVYIC